MVICSIERHIRERHSYHVTSENNGLLLHKVIKLAFSFVAQSSGLQWSRMLFLFPFGTGRGFGSLHFVCHVFKCVTELVDLSNIQNSHLVN